MKLDLTDKVALVTGGSQGIGAAVCRELAAQGCDTALTFVGEPTDAEPVVAAIESTGRRALPLVANAADSADTERAVAATVETLGGLDILVCNAGITRDGVVWKLSDEQWDDVIAVNLRGYFTFIRAAARIFKKRLGCREGLGTGFFPESSRRSKSRYTTLRRNTGACRHNDGRFGGSKRLYDLIWNGNRVHRTEDRHETQ